MRNMVLNVHERIIHQPIHRVVLLFSTLASPGDKVWPAEKWPKMRFKDGLRVGAKGGHGPIRYRIEAYDPGHLIRFRFTGPKGFHGSHWLEWKPTGNDKTLVRHTIDMYTTGRATWYWLIAIRWLHDALIEDAFDKVENHFKPGKKTSSWSPWVRFLRAILSMGKAFRSRHKTEAVNR